MNDEKLIWEAYKQKIIKENRNLINLAEILGDDAAAMFDFHKYHDGQRDILYSIGSSGLMDMNFSNLISLQKRIKESIELMDKLSSDLQNKFDDVLSQIRDIPTYGDYEFDPDNNEEDSEEPLIEYTKINTNDVLSKYYKTSSGNGNGGGGDDTNNNYGDGDDYEDEFNKLYKKLISIYKEIEEISYDRENFLNFINRVNKEFPESDFDNEGEEEGEYKGKYQNV